MIFILQAFLLYSEYELVKCACFLWILAQQGIGENHPASFDARRAPEQRSPLRYLRSATQSPAIPRRAVSLKLVPPGQGNLCPEPRTPKGNLFSVARTPGLFETPRFFCRPLPLPHTHTVYFEKTNTNDFYFASIPTLQRI